MATETAARSLLRRPVREARRLPRGFAVALAVVSLALAAVGCGSSESTGTATGAGTGTDGETVTVTHAYGTTQVPVNPTRVVSLDTQWTDVLAALGHTPVAYITDANVPDDFPWRDAELREAGTLHATTALPFEKIAALKPDLIVVTYLADSKAAYDKLAKIAPTIATLGEGTVDTWQDITATAGEVFATSTEADELIADVEGRIEQVKTDLPGLEGRTMAMANYVAGDGIYVVADPGDGSMSLFTQFDMAITPTILDAGNVDQGRVKLSFERIDMLDADLLVLLLNGADPADIAGFADLPAVQSGAVAELDYGDAVGLNTPTPLSIPYVLEKIRPALEQAAA